MNIKTICWDLAIGCKVPERKIFLKICVKTGNLYLINYHAGLKQGVFSVRPLYAEINIMALQNENNLKTQLPIWKINDLQMLLSLIFAKFLGVVLNIG